jgi:hypothetical protein
MALYEIYTAQDLQKFRDEVNDGNNNFNAILMNDIDLEGTVDNQWIPISRPIGVFDGNGHTISGLYINMNVSTNGVGFVSYTGMGSSRDTFTVKNLTIEGNIILRSGLDEVGGIIAHIGCNVNIISCKSKVNITLERGCRYVGGIIGYADSHEARVINCINEGNIIGIENSSVGVGGIIGRGTGDHYIENCINKGNITVTNRIGYPNDQNLVGGIVGMSRCTIKNCINEGNITVTNYAGGIVANDSSGTIENCINKGNITAINYAGGIAGVISPPVYIENCINEGNITATNNVGGIVGYFSPYYYEYIYTLNRNINIGLISGTTNYGAIIGNIGNTESSFSDLLYTSINNNGFILIDNYYSESSCSYGIGNPATTEEPTHIIKFAGSELPIFPDPPTYEIYTAQDLRRFRDLVNLGYTNISAKLMNDIDLQGNDLDQWEPIAINYYASFSGTFDGNGYTISGLYINRSTILDEYGEPDYDIDELAFIRYADGAVIKNLILEGYILGGWYGVAGFVAYLQDGKIINCINRVVLTGPEWGFAMGGFVVMGSGEIINCINEADIGRNDLYCYRLGGIAEDYDSGYIINCINKGNIYGEDSAGIAYSIADTTINNCVNEGNIFAGTEYACGIAMNYSNNIITNCVNKGIITGDYGIAGIVDYVTPDLELKNCVNEGTINCEYDYGSIFRTLDTGETITYDDDYSVSFVLNDGNINMGTVYPNYKHYYHDTELDYNIYEIYTTQDLKDFRDLVNLGYTNISAKLMNDIDLQGNESDQWIPIGLDITTPFSGYFDGNGHTISGIYMNTNTYDHAGFIGYYKNINTDDSLKQNNWGIPDVSNIFISNIKNLTVNGYIRNTKSNSPGSTAGGIIGYANSINIYNCINKADIVNNNNNGWTGGIIGYMVEESIVNACINEGNISNGGGIIGVSNSYENSIIINCINKGSITNGNGIIRNSPDLAKPITNCTNEGNITNGNGIAGDLYNTGMVNCVNKGDIIDGNGLVAGAYAGRLINCVNEGNITNGNGITAAIQDGGMVNCVNNGDIIDGNGLADRVYAGGLINCVNEGNIIVRTKSEIGGLINALYNGNVLNCINKGNITIESTNTSVTSVGGLLSANFAYNISITNCINEGNITNESNEDITIGGILSRNYGTAVGLYGINNCVNTGTITNNVVSTRGLGGIIGSFIGGKMKITNCVNLGNIVSSVNEYNKGAILGDTGIFPLTEETIDTDLTPNMFNNFYLNTTCSTSVGSYRKYGPQNYIIIDVLEGHLDSFTLGNSPAVSCLIDKNTSESIIYPYYNTDISTISYTENIENDDYSVSFVLNDGNINMGTVYPNTEHHYAIDKIDNIMHKHIKETYYINNESELKDFRDLVNAGNYNLNAKLMNNIGWLEDDWVPICHENGIYNGIFDGNNYKILGINITSTDTHYRGFISKAGKDAIIKNLKLEGTMTISGGDSHGGIVGIGYGCKIINCTSNISFNCTNNASIIGGIVGQLSNGPLNELSKIINCNNINQINSNGSQIGGIVGNIDDASINIINCYNGSDISGKDCVSGIVGYGYCTLYNCVNEGHIVATGDTHNGSVAGIAYTGDAYNCCNSGLITGTKYVGGILSWGGTAVNCVNNGIIEALNTSSDWGYGAIFGDNDVNILSTHNNYYSSDSCDRAYTNGTLDTYIVSTPGVIDICTDSTLPATSYRLYNDYIYNIFDITTIYPVTYNTNISNVTPTGFNIVKYLPENNFYLDTTSNQAGVYEDNDSVIISIPDSITPYTEGNAPTVSALVDTMYAEPNSLIVKLYPYYNPSISTVTFSDWGISNSRIAEVNDDGTIELKRSGTFNLDYNTSFVLNSGNKSLGTVNIVDKFIKVINLPSKYLIKHLKQYNNYLFCLFVDNK